jgi:hypothetical protein
MSQVMILLCSKLDDRFDVVTMDRHPPRARLDVGSALTAPSDGREFAFDVYYSAFNSPIRVK